VSRDSRVHLEQDTFVSRNPRDSRGRLQSQDSEPVSVSVSVSVFVPVCVSMFVCVSASVSRGPLETLFLRL